FPIISRIEEGTYGVVYRARDKRTEEVVALKRLKMEKEKEGFPITSLREINTLLKAQHPNIVTVREIVVGSNMDKIFIEYSTPVDMWSVGCIFGEFLSMEALFPGKSEKMTFTEYPVSQLRSRFGTMITDVGMDLMNKFLTYDPVQRVTAEDALRHDYFKEAPLPIDPAMFPTWPAKSELGHRKAAAASPKPPPGGHEYKQLGDTDEDVPVGGFHMGLVEKGRTTSGPGFSLKF
ncbi:Cyclin-dependent kinase 11B, partial [Blattella germanica]